MDCAGGKGRREGGREGERKKVEVCGLRDVHVYSWLVFFPLKGNSYQNNTKLIERFIRPYVPAPPLPPQDCVDMDCDGPKHALIVDSDGRFTGSYPERGSVAPFAELRYASNLIGCYHNNNQLLHHKP